MAAGGLLTYAPACMTELEQITAETLEETFAFLDDWEERYRFIIELGRKLSPLPDEHKIEVNRIQGCQSNVWVTVRLDSGGDGSILLAADSEAHIVKGLAAMVVALLHKRTAREVVDADIRGLFDRLDLHQHLSPTRSNGLHGLVTQIKTRAAELLVG